MSKEKEKFIRRAVRGILKKEGLYGIGISPRERKIVGLRAEGNTYEEIATKSNCSRQRIHQIIQRVEEKKLKQNKLAKKIAKKIGSSVDPEDIKVIVEWELSLKDMACSLKRIEETLDKVFRKSG